MTEAIQAPAAARTKKKAAAESDQQQRKALPPLTEVLPILDETVNVGRQSGRKTEKSGKRGAWREKPKEAAKAGAAQGVIALNPATGPEEPGKAPGPEFVKSWQEPKTESKTWDVHDLHPGTEAKPEGEDGEPAGGEAETGEPAGGEAETGEHDTGEHDSGDAAEGDEAQGGEAAGGEHEEEEEKPPTPGAWGSDAEFRKAVEVLAFATERLEDDIKSGKKKDTSKNYEVGAGAKGKVSETIETRSGNRRTTSTASAEGLAGVRAAAKTLLVADEDMVMAAVSAMAQAGAFGSAGTTFDVTKGKAAISLAVQSSGGIGAQVQSSATALADLNKLIPALCAVFEFSAQVGVWGQLSGSASARYGRLTASICSVISGFAGAAVEAKGAAFADYIEGIGLSGQVGAKAGAEGKAATTVTLDLKDIGELEIEAGVMAFAGAEVKAKGKAAISVTGVSVEGRASAFAGARVSSYAKVGAKVRGREFLKVSGKVGVAVGAGAEVGGKFEFIRGKLVISGDLAAVLKGGGDVGAGLELDLAALAVGIGQVVADEWNKEKFEINQAGVDFHREELAATDKARATQLQKDAYEAVLPGFQDYAADVLDKARGGKLDRSKVLVQTELTKKIQDVAPRLDTKWIETDRGIERAAQDAFGDLIVTKGGRAQFGVDACVVRFVDSVSPAKAKELAERQKMLRNVQKVNTALRKDLQIYANAKRAGGASGVKKDRVQEIINKHWPQLVEAFPGAETKHAITYAVRDTIGDYLGYEADGRLKFKVSDKGWIDEFGGDDAAKLAGEQKAGFKASIASQKTDAAARELKSQLTKYKTKLVADANANFDMGKVAGFIAAAGKRVPDDAKKSEAQSTLAAAVVEALDPLVDQVEITDDLTLGSLHHKGGELIKARNERTQTAAEAGRQAAIDTFSKSLQGKRDSLLKKGLPPDKFQDEITRWSATHVLKADRAMGKAAGKSKKDATLKENSADLEAAADAVLAPLLRVRIVWGALVGVQGSLASQAAFAEEQRKANATVKGGSDQDNARRALLAKAVRKDFDSYAGELRAALQDEIARKKSKKPRPKAAERARLQKIIDERTANIGNDVKNEVGDAALLYAVDHHFGLADKPSAQDDKTGVAGRTTLGSALIKKFSSKELKIDEFKPVPLSQLAGAAVRKQGSVLQQQRVQAELSKEINQAVAAAAKNRKRLQAGDLQELVDKHAKAKLPHDTDEDLRVLDAVVTVALGPTARSLFEVDHGVIKPAAASPAAKPDAALEALAKLRHELEQYAAERRKAKMPFDKQGVQSCLDAFANNVGGVNEDHDELLADTVAKALGGGSVVTVRKGKIAVFRPAA